MNNKQARQAPYEKGTLLKRSTDVSGLYLVTGRGIAMVQRTSFKRGLRQEAYSFSARRYVHIYISGYTPVDGSGPTWEVTP